MSQPTTCSSTVAPHLHYLRTMIFVSSCLVVTILTSVGPAVMAAQKALEVCLLKKNRGNEAEAEDDCNPQQVVDEQRPNTVQVEGSISTSNRRIVNGRLNRVLNSSIKMLMKMPRIHEMVLRLHRKDPDDDIEDRNVTAARTAFDAAKDMWCAAKEALEAAIDDKKKTIGARNGGENNNALYEEEDAEERVTMAQQVFNGADRAFQSASKAFNGAHKVVEEKKMIDALAWAFEELKHDFSLTLDMSRLLPVLSKLAELNAVEFESGMQEDAPKANTLFLEAMEEVAIRAKVLR